MTVFKGYMKIVKANVGLMLMYLAIFFGITNDDPGSYKRYRERQLQRGKRTCRHR